MEGEDVIPTESMLQAGLAAWDHAWRSTDPRLGRLVLIEAVWNAMVPAIPVDEKASHAG